MTKMIWYSFGVVLCASLLATTASAREKSTTGVQRTRAAVRKTTRTAWPSETLAGKIVLIDPAKRMVIVKGPDGVPFDMLVTPSTRITSGSHRLTLKDLDVHKQKGVSVRFIPERAGDIARSVQVTE
jgi:hypothetical protein